jgi:hypothetical protein
MNNRMLGTKIAAWLRRREGDCFCDNCIAGDMTEEDPRNVHRTAIGLGRGPEPECSRFRAKCAACGKDAIVSMARRNLGVV